MTRVFAVRAWIVVTSAVLVPGSLAGPGFGRTWVVAQKHTKADDTGPGNTDRPFRSIAPAADRAEPGDVVLVHQGVYRERVKPARGGEPGRPITYTAAEGESVVIKGSDVYSGTWEAVAGSPNVYRASLAEMTFGLYNPFETPHCALENRTRGQVFVDGVRLREVGSLDEVKAVPGSWFSAADRNAVVVHFPWAKPPSRCLVELTTRTRIFAPVKRGLGHITVRGFVMEHCGNNYQRAFYAKGRKTVQAGALGCRGGHHWVIENNTIRWAKALAIDCGDEGWYDLEGLQQPPGKTPGHHLIRGNVICDNGCGGIAGLKSLKTIIIGNRIERNNYLGIDRPETAGVKMHFFVGGLIEGNLFLDNETYGVWLDNVYAHARVTRNVCLGNKTAGIFLEMGGGPALVDNNVVAYTRGEHNGAGIYAHDAGGITFAHNLVLGNALYGFYFRKVTGRSHAHYPEVIDSWDTPPTGRLPCIPDRIKLYNNLVFCNGRGLINMPYPGPIAANNDSDHNLFKTGGHMSWMNMAPFVLNTNGGVDEDGIVAAYHKAMDEQEVSREQRPTLVSYHKGPLLDLAQWQLLSGFDRHSSSPDGMARIVTPELTLLLEADDTYWNLECPPVEGVEVDFFGTPMPEAGRLPGPFQNLQKGKNRLVLWPVRMLCEQ